MPFSAQKEKEDESVRKKKAFNEYLLSQWKKIKKATDTPDECEDKIKYSWEAMTEENRLKYFNVVESGNRTLTEECIICKNKLKATILRMTGCDLYLF